MHFRSRLPRCKSSENGDFPRVGLQGVAIRGKKRVGVEAAGPHSDLEVLDRGNESGVELN